MKYQPKLLNLEVTTKCPLMCPQCYCSLNTGKDLKKEVAQHWIDQAASNGVEVINISGGETLCYPHIFDIIQYASNNGIAVNVALSGFGFNRNVLEELIRSGVDGIFISLNGSTEEINMKSRNGFQYALEALDLLKNEHFPNTTINWVMQASNSDDFGNMIELAEEYHVARIVILGLKPNSSKELSECPSLDQMKRVKRQIREYKGKVQINVESCYSPFLALYKDSYLFENTNTVEPIGCMAGRWSMSVSVDGLLSPCRHINIFEERDTLQDYWNNSETLLKLRNIEADKREPCVNCAYTNYCRHCVAINTALNNDIYLGYDNCQLYKMK